MKLTSLPTKFAAASFALMLVFSISAFGQRKTTTTAKKPPVPPVTSLDVRDAKTKVANQIKNVSKFMYILGTAASGLELTEKDLKANKLSPSARDNHAQNKQKILVSIRNLKAGLAELETAFRSKPALRNYLLNIQGVTDLATQSEDLATQAQFAESGRPFLAIIEKLTDTLAALPN